MPRFELTIIEVRQDPEGWLSGLVDCPPGLAIGPGQYLLAHATGSAEALPSALFAAGLLPSTSGLEIAPPLPPGWAAGTRLSVRGPLGRGFQLPPTARRVALVAGPSPAYALLPLAGAALVQDAAVALYARRVPAGLPSEVEVLPPEALSEMIGWADFAAVQMQPGGLSGLRRRLGLAPHAMMPVPTQVLVQVPMPCGGTGECGICAVSTRKGWKLACKDGPVFDFNELEEA